MARLTFDHFRQQYRRNLASTQRDLVKARALAPRKLRGYTVADLEGQVATLERLIAMSDAQLASWLSPAAVAARLQDIKRRHGWTLDAPEPASDHDLLRCRACGTELESPAAVDCPDCAFAGAR